MSKIQFRFYSAQILVTSLIIITILTLAIVAITTTVQRSASRTSLNLEYESNYNQSNDVLVSNINVFSNQDLQSPDEFAAQLENFEISLASDLSVSFETCSDDLSGRDESVVCVFSDNLSGIRTLVSVFPSKTVNNYSLLPGESFDIILPEQATATTQLEVSWLGSTAFDYQLIYESEIDDLQTMQAVIDPNNTNTYNNLMSDGISKLSANFTEGSPHKLELEIDGNYNNIQILRLTPISRNNSVSIDIRPTGTQNLPDQVRVIESVSYDPNKIETSSPVVTTQVPISQRVPPVIYNAATFRGFKSSTCGNGVIEGAESCDDGNEEDEDDCRSDCTIKFSKNFSFDIRPMCEWERDNRENWRSSSTNGYKSLTQNLVLPADRAPQNLNITAPNQTVRYDDEILLLINDVVVAASSSQLFSYTDRQNINGVEVPFYGNYQNYSRKRHIEGGTRCWETSENGCTIPQSEESGTLLLNFNNTASSILSQQIAKDGYVIEVTLVVFGDDDFNTDCKASLNLSIDGFI